MVAVALFGVLGACSSPVDPGTDECPQTYEFGNYGCARFVVLLGDEIPAPSTLEWSASYSVIGGSHSLTLPFRGEDRSRVLEITNYSWPMDVELVIVTKVWDQVGRPPTGSSYPLVASDSARYQVKFAEVGAVPSVDTIRLAKAPSEGSED